MIKKTIKILLITFNILSLILHVNAQTAVPISQSFELRHYTQDSSANGETDFKGETAWMNLDQRIAFLRHYAEYGSRFFNDKNLNTRIVNEIEKKTLLNNWKPQPLTSIRKTIVLSDWKSYGYRTGQDARKKEALRKWESYPGVKINDGRIYLSDTRIEMNLDSIVWRFKLEINLVIDKGASLKLGLGDTSGKVVDVAMKDFSLDVISNRKVVHSKIKPSTSEDRIIHLVIEGDFSEQCMNVYANGKLLLNFTPFANSGTKCINQLNIVTKGNVEVDDIFLFHHNFLRESAGCPIHSSIVLDENFEEKPDIAGWQFPGFSDSHWKTVSLPAVHGGIREAGESLYLRHELEIDTFERATLDFETIDPAGEVWINGQVVAVTNGRHPKQLDVTPYLKVGKNLLAVKVKPYYAQNPMPHAPDDRHIGWFLGRTKLMLSSECMIQTAEAYTKELSCENTIQTHCITVQFPRKDYFKGSLEVKYYPWFPEEGDQIASKQIDVQIRPRISNLFNIDIEIPKAALWSADNPNLYKVKVILKDTLGNNLDDVVFTTGIRTISQKGGELLINGKPEMLNGAQIMGLRTPLETMAKFNRCAPIDDIAEEMLMLKKMGANMLRLHVHAELDTIDGINDPRYAELADQMGIYLIWSTAGFIRAGEAWNVDFEGYPLYMAQVYNHPSIVIWEASNHPNKFKNHDISDTNDFIRKIYQIISDRDPSRLISPTTFWQHTHYANHEGTLDSDGNSIEAVDEFHASLMTRGSQDAYSGYGTEWSKIRKMPNAWAKSVLKANDKAYFNFEHEESAGQPNWELHKGKPWYKVHSYEWEYEEGSIGKKIGFEDWQVSQAYQAFSAWESMKKQMLIGYDGFSWCTLEGGANMGTYQKPLVDNLGHAKMAYYVNRMTFQRTWAGSDNVDIVFGPSDLITPVIHHIGDKQKVNLEIRLETVSGKIIEQKTYKNIELNKGRNVSKLPPFHFKKAKEGTYGIHYIISLVGT